MLLKIDEEQRHLQLRRRMHATSTPSLFTDESEGNASTVQPSPFTRGTMTSQYLLAAIEDAQRICRGETETTNGSINYRYDRFD